MLQVPDHIVPEPTTLTVLNEYQTEINNLVTFAEKSKEAERLFKLRNIPANPVFRDVREKLAQLCSGAQRCIYCEDSAGYEVEHIYPKKRYPEYCFSWENYIFACGLCNNTKNDNFDIFGYGSNEVIQVQRNTQPPAGDPVLINPRLENGLGYFKLDIAGTFSFLIIENLAERDQTKANYTLQVLGLNRAFLNQARKKAFGNYKARVCHYQFAKADGADNTVLEKLKEGLLTENHPTVWKEILRYYNNGSLAIVDPQFNEWLQLLPEVLIW